MDPQPIEGAAPPQLPMRPRPQILRMAPLRVAPLQTDEIIRIRLPHQRRLHHRIQRPNHILPHRAPPTPPLKPHAPPLPRRIIRLQHAQLIRRDPKRLPQEGFLRHNQVRKQPTHDHGADLPPPDLPLFGAGQQAEETDGVAGAARLVEAAGRGREDVGVREPELEGAGGEVRREVAEEQAAEARVPARAEERPEVCVGERGEGGELEFQEVVLVGVEVDGVEAVRALQRVGEDVVAGAGDGEDGVVKA
ncbi:hypothetical protein EYC80_003891 [Monilinia laxa]|uniref:Uncharacterized protein n=1 Tax=Monilinia laxa TaxID=61186 RepID=A0A5N6KL34_MONLA|nr:hypothetical protein EYC80_003891 [Monilinia laxa]